MSGGWLTRPKVPGIHKIQIFKNQDARWVMIMPTKDMKTRHMIRFQTWQAAFEVAMTIQDGINRNRT